MDALNPYIQGPPVGNLGSTSPNWISSVVDVASSGDTFDVFSSDDVA